MPMSLLQLAGAPLHPSPLDKAALVVIDHQMEYVTGNVPVAGIAAARAEIGRLLALARRNDVPVFHVLHHGRPGGSVFDPGGPFVAVIPELAPVDGEAVIIKGLPNSFAGTGLHALLQATGRSEVIIAGFATHMCVSATTRAALDLGYRTTVVAAACATRDLPDPLGGTIPADVLHRAELAALADRFAVVAADSSAWA